MGREAEARVNICLLDSDKKLEKSSRSNGEAREANHTHENQLPAKSAPSDLDRWMEDRMVEKNWDDVDSGSLEEPCGICRG